MTDLVRSLRQAARQLIRMRAAGLAAVAALALGIGATTTMASVAYATLIRPVPFPDAARLVVLYNTRFTPRDGLVRLRWSFPHVRDLRASLSSVDHLASFSSASLGVRASGPPQQLDGEVVSPEYFDLLGAAPASGRAFAPADAGQNVIVISDQLWRTGLDADPRAVGGVVRVSDVPLTIVGVMPSGFSGLSGRGQFWIPPWLAARLSYGEYLTSPQHFISAAAKLKPGVTLGRANAELASIGDRFADAPPRPDAVWSAVAVPATDARVDPSARRSVRLLFAAAGCLLLIACVNVAGVLLARAAGRRQELAVRLALGASRGRILAQLLTEGVVLAAAAGIAGAALALAGVRLLGAASPTLIASWRNDYAAISAFAEPAADARFLLFAVLATFATTLAASLAPALSASRHQPAPGLRAGGRGSTRQGRVLPALVAIEIAASVVLLAGAGVVVANLSRLNHLRRGFDSSRVLTFWIRPPASRYAPADGPAALARFLDAIERVPGVESAAVNRAVPFSGGARTTLTFTDRPNVTGEAPVVGRHYISENYFRTLGIPLLAGRALTTADRAGAAPVTVINETAARRFWPGANPVGQRVAFGATTGFTDPAHPVEVVGVVGDVKYEDADQPVGPDFYTSFRQFAYPDSMVIVKAVGAAPALEPALRAAVASVDAAVPLFEVMPLDERVDRALGRVRFNTTLLAAFASAAVLVAAIGVYGVISFAVWTRQREIGVRMALGATPARVLRRFVGRGLVMAGIGAVGGSLAAVALVRFAGAFVADLGRADWRVLTGVALVMIGVGALASLVPARRASTVDPVAVLRSD